MDMPQPSAFHHLVQSVIQIVKTTGRCPQFRVKPVSEVSHQRLGFWPQVLHHLQQERHTFCDLRLQSYSGHFHNMLTTRLQHCLPARPTPPRQPRKRKPQIAPKAFRYNNKKRQVRKFANMSVMFAPFWHPFLCHFLSRLAYFSGHLESHQSRITQAIAHDPAKRHQHHSPKSQPPGLTAEFDST